MEAEQLPAVENEFTVIQSDDPTAAAFMMYTELSQNAGVYSVLRAQKSWGWLIRWTYSDGTQIDVHVENTHPKPKYDA